MYFSFGIMKPEILTFADRSRYLKTPMTKVYTDDPEYTNYILGRTPAGRWGLPEDFRGAVIFLASRASDFMTGSSLVLDGGLIAK